MPLATGSQVRRRSCRCDIHDGLRRSGAGVKQTFETAAGTVEIVLDEQSRIVSAYRFDAQRRPLAAAIESFDEVDLADVLVRQVGVPSVDAREIATRVRPFLPAIRKLPSEREASVSRNGGSNALENAGLALRFVAVLLDTVIVFLPLSIVVGLLTGGGYSESGSGYANAGVDLGGRALLLLLMLGLGYYILCEALTGMTVGKRMVGIRVVAEDGEHVTLGAATVRNLLRLVDALFFYLVAAAFALASARGQRLGDRAARTLVIRR
jgi:uncharacterized RDD family membrane protein YckC